MLPSHVNPFRKLVLVLVAALLATPLVSIADKAKMAELRAKQTELEAQSNALTVKRAELEKQRRALQARIDARHSELDGDQQVRDLRAALTDAQRAADNYVKTDPGLETLRKARDQAQQAVEPIRQQVLRSGDEAKAIETERARIALEDAMLDFRARETDFIMQRKVTPRLYAENRDLAAAANKKNSLWRRIEAVRREMDSDNAELKAMREESEKLRAAYYKENAAARPEELTDLYKTRSEKEAAYRDISGRKLREADKALTEARSEADQARSKAMSADQEAGELSNLLADLRKQKEEIEYQIALNEFRLREGVARRIGFDPEVRKADGDRWRAENARREIENSDPDIAAARNEMNEVRGKINELENRARTAPAVVEAEKAWRAREGEYNTLRAKLHREATAELQTELNQAAQAEQELRDKLSVADEQAAELNKETAAVNEDREAGRKRRAEIDAQWRVLYDKTLEDGKVKTALQAADAARKAYTDGYAASDAPKLTQSVKDAQKMLAQKVGELRKGDEVCAALNTQLSELNQKAGELDGQIRSVSKETEDTAFQIITLGLEPVDIRKKDLGNGLVLRCYEPDTSPDADFHKKAEPAKVLKADIVDHSQRTRDENFGLTFDGYIEIPKDGDYSFSLASDDGSYLYLGGMLIVDNGGSHGIVEKSRKLTLKAGMYPIKVTFFQGGGGFGLSLHWAGPEIEKQVVPTSALFALKKDLPKK